MKLMLDKFYTFLERPMEFWTRPLLAALAIPLVLSFTAPLWRISMTAPQYPDGLYLDIYAYKLEGGNDGQHLQEINTLNHYIGMRPIDRASMADLDWIPFALGALVLMTLRVAAIGTIRMLLDLTVLTSYVSLFALGRFAYRLWIFGHDLNPDAPVKVQPFMPVLFGSKQIANFFTQSLPQRGSIFMGLFVVGVLFVAAFHLIRGRRRAVQGQGA